MVSLELICVQGESDPIDSLCNMMLYKSMLGYNCAIRAANVES